MSNSKSGLDNLFILSRAWRDAGRRVGKRASMMGPFKILGQLIELPVQIKKLQKK